MLAADAPGPGLPTGDGEPSPADDPVADRATQLPAGADIAVEPGLAVAWGEPQALTAKAAGRTTAEARRRPEARWPCAMRAEQTSIPTPPTIWRSRSSDS